MKKIFIFGVALALVALLAAGLFAADRKGKIEVGVGAGLLLPMGDFGDDFKMGWRAGAGVGYFFTDEIALGVNGAYSQNKVDDTTGVGDATFKMMQYGAFGKYVFKMQNDKIAPYLKAGLGFYNAKVSVSGGGSSPSNTDLGINGGVGVNFAISPTAAIFVEGAFHDIFSDPSSTNFITAMAGVAFMFGGSSSSGGTQ